MVNPYNPGKASKELKYLLENKNECDKLKKMCKTSLNKYEYESILKKYIRIFKQISKI